MRKTILAGMSAAVTLLAAPGCSTVREMPRAAVEQELKTPEQRLCRELLICFLKNDAGGFVNRLPEETRETFDRKQFEETRRAMVGTVGEPVSFQYLTTLEFAVLQPHIWKVRFHRTPKGKKEMYSEALFRIVTGRDASGNVLVLGFNFL